MVMSQKSIIFAHEFKNILYMKYIRKYDKILADYVIEEVDGFYGDGFDFLDIIMIIAYSLCVLFMIGFILLMIFL